MLCRPLPSPISTRSCARAVPIPQYLLALQSPLWGHCLGRSHGTPCPTTLAGWAIPSQSASEQLTAPHPTPPAVHTHAPQSIIPPVLASRSDRWQDTLGEVLGGQVCNPLGSRDPPGTSAGSYSTELPPGGALPCFTARAPFARGRPRCALLQPLFYLLPHPHTLHPSARSSWPASPERWPSVTPGRRLWRGGSERASSCHSSAQVFGQRLWSVPTGSPHHAGAASPDQALVNNPSLAPLPDFSFCAPEAGGLACPAPRPGA